MMTHHILSPSKRLQRQLIVDLRNKNRVVGLQGRRRFPLTLYHSMQAPENGHRNSDGMARERQTYFAVTSAPAEEVIGTW